MNERQRLIATLKFGQPDKLPFDPGGPRESTLAAWHQQGLPEGVDWYTHLMQLLGIPYQPEENRLDLGVTFGMLPTFEEKVLEHHDGHYLVQDWMGAIVEISDQYDYTYLRQAKDFVTRKWHRFPVQTRQEWVEKITWRYNPDQPERFPADFPARCAQLKDRDYVLALYFPGPFWQLREWCGFEGLCLFMADQPVFVEEMVEFYASFVLQTLDRVLAQAQPDYVMLSEDMAYKLHSMISPKMVRRFLLPTWRLITDKLKTAGCGVVSIDSDGYVGELIPLFIEGGFESTWPLEVAAGNDLPAFRARYGTAISYGGGIDKRALATGDAVMLAELARLEPVMRAGGYLPGCDHGIPPDISWPNFIAYARRLAQLTGWL